MFRFPDLKQTRRKDDGNPKLPGRVAETAVENNLFLPMAHQGSIIVTTRLSQLVIGYQNQIRTEKLKTKHDSMQILSKTSGREGLQYGKDILPVSFQLLVSP